MRKYSAIILLFLLASCTSPNRESEFVIVKKEQVDGGFHQNFTDANMGRFKYNIDVTQSDFSFVYYSDSDWQLGKPLHLVPKFYCF